MAVLITASLEGHSLDFPQGSIVRFVVQLLLKLREKMNKHVNLFRHLMYSQIKAKAST